ncbi:MAG: alanine dehydrogenase [Saprospirales bacterium]|nr:alanine dehydrogenase [Saprospirales bacterium]MBK8492398.1 alanine dehydrogenase [Saprospirales bacterium]
MKLGIIKEGKIPPDSRVPLVPDQCAAILKQFPIELTVQHSPIRCYKDEEFERAGITLTDDLTDCDVLMGVKEVPVNKLIPGKTYFFFSHTIKKQPYNRRMLQAILEKNIRLIDYEILTDEQGFRLIAFGRFAGMVGAHNALYTYSLRTGAFVLPRMKDCHDYEEAKGLYRKIKFPPIKVVVTGGGRVSGGACEVLGDMGFQRVSPADFLFTHFDYPVFTQLNPEQYAARKDGKLFTPKDFYEHPEEFDSAFSPYAQVADIFINGIFFDQRAPAFFTVEEMRKPEFNIQVIADVTCDIAPKSSVPSTLRASTIADPIFGFDPVSRSETQPFQDGIIDVMSIDNLPNEMPRDASRAFGEQFITKILPELLKPESKVIERATIADKGHLTPHYMYLRDFVEGE